MPAARRVPCGSPARSATSGTTPSASGSSCSATSSSRTGPAEAVAGAAFVHSDTWVSMGQEADEQERKQAFEGFTVDAALMDRAAPGAHFLHCLPAYRGLEVTADVIDGPRSVVFQQGHNRLHSARAAIAFLLECPERSDGPSGCHARRAGCHRPTRSDEHHGRAAMSLKQQRQQAIGRLIGQQPVANQPQLLDLLGARGHHRHAGHGLAGPRGARSDQGAGARRTVRVRVAGAGDRPLRAVRPAAARAGGVGRRGRRLGQPRRAAHAAGLRPRRRLGPRPQRPRRAPRHGRRRRHVAVRRRRHDDRRRARRPPAPAGGPGDRAATDDAPTADRPTPCGTAASPAARPTPSSPTRSACRSTVACGPTTSPARAPTSAACGAPGC